MGQSNDKPLAFAEMPDLFQAEPPSGATAVGIGATKGNSQMPQSNSHGAAGEMKSSNIGSSKPKMRAWVVERPSSSIQSVRACHVEVPDPKGTQILIAVVCASINPFDVKRVRLVADDVVFPAVLGLDVAGTVAAIGPNVDGLGLGISIGDHVCAHLGLQSKYGSFADFCIADAQSCCKIPTNVSFADAAAAPTSGCAAYIALFDKLRVEAGRSIFIAGGAGGVGSFAIQLAKYAKLRVATTCSSCNAQYVRQLGADLVLEYSSEGVVTEQIAAFTGGIGVDYALDCVSPRNALQSAQLLRFGGSIVSLAGHISGDVSFFEHQLSIHSVFLPGLQKIEWGLPLLRSVGDGMMALLSAGIVKAPLSQVISFEQLPNALSVVAGGHSRGKVVLSMSSKKRQQQQDNTKAVEVPL